MAGGDSLGQQRCQVKIRINSEAKTMTSLASKSLVYRSLVSACARATACRCVPNHAETVKSMTGSNAVFVNEMTCHASGGSATCLICWLVRIASRALITTWPARARCVSSARRCSSSSALARMIPSWLFRRWKSFVRSLFETAASDWSPVIMNFRLSDADPDPPETHRGVRWHRAKGCR